MFQGERKLLSFDRLYDCCHIVNCCLVMLGLCFRNGFIFYMTYLENKFIRKVFFIMERNSKLLKRIMLAMMVAMGVVISPILRIEGMCPMSSVINIVCAVILGPWYALLCAVMIGILRMAVMAIPPLALTGAVFGAFLSGVLYRASKGNLIFAVLGEVIGTGIIGALMSYPVMTFIWGRAGLTWLFYVPLFFMATIIGGIIAFAFLQALSMSGMLAKIQRSLGEEAYDKQPIGNKEEY